MDNKRKCARLTKAEKETLSCAPDIYKEQYGEICGKTSVRKGIRKYIVYVTSDGRLMQAARPFLLKDEKDWEPKYFGSEEAAAEYLEDRESEFIHQDEERICREYGTERKKGTGFRRIFTFCPTRDEGWYLALSNLHPTRWIVGEGARPEEGWFLCEWIIPGKPMRVDNVLELNDGRKARIMEVRRVGNAIDYPLAKFEFISEEDCMLDEKVKQCIRDGVVDREIFVTPAQASALFYDNADSDDCVPLRCCPKGRRYSYIPVRKLSSDNMYKNFKRKFSRVLYEIQARTLKDFLKYAGHGDSAEITFEETLCGMTDRAFGSSFPETPPTGWEKLFREKVAVPFIEETGFWEGYTKEQSVEKLCSFFCGTTKEQ